MAEDTINNTLEEKNNSEIQDGSEQVLSSSPLQMLRQDIQYDDDAPFGVTARVVMQLGRESISNSITAIIELVKNAYDADAESVSLEFHGLGTDFPFLIIEDDGDGMNQEQIRTSWLMIGTSTKQNGDGRSSRKKRVLTGEKGLGRLGIDRLCNETILQSFVEIDEDDETTFDGTELYIDWTRYEHNSQQSIDQIRHDIRNISRETVDPLLKQGVGKPKGTRIILYNLKDDWTKEYIADMRNELLLLISPFSGINDFKIRIDSGQGWNSVDGPVSSGHMLEGAQWKLLSSLSLNATTGKWELEHLMYSDVLSQEYAFAPQLWVDTFPGKNEESLVCGPLKFEMYFYPRKGTKLADLTITKTQIEEFLDSNQGIRIYRDDFRVKPYGEPDGTGDWLTLSYRRQASPQGVAQEPLGGWRVGYNQVIGAVFISRDDNPNLIDQTNRESIVEGKPFNQMKEVIMHAISFFERNRQRYEMGQRDKNAFEMAKEMANLAAQDASNASNELEKLFSEVETLLVEEGQADSGTIKKFRDVTNKVKRATSRAARTQRTLAKAADSEQAKLERQKDTLGNLASLGILTTAFGHETLASANLVNHNSKDLYEDLINGLFMVQPDIREDIEDTLETIVSESGRIETFAEFTLRNISRDKRNRLNVDLKEIVETVFNYFEDSLKEKNIEVDLSEVQPVPLFRAYRIDWESIIVNLITNAVWAMENRSYNEREIKISLWESAEQIHLKFCDSGIGIPAGMWEDIFLPTVSTKTNEKDEITGTGMGLAIVKGFVESYSGGDISVSSPGELGGAEFHIVVDVPKYSQKGAN